MCNEQTGLNYQATVENQNKIAKLTRELHDREMLIDDMEQRLRNLQRRVRELER